MAIGLKQRIQGARTFKQLDELLALGMSTFKDASKQTKRSWQAAADKRRHQLNNGDSPSSKT